jgi:hypothetical protein
VKHQLWLQKGEEMRALRPTAALLCAIAALASGCTSGGFEGGGGELIVTQPSAINYLGFRRTEPVTINYITGPGATGGTATLSGDGSGRFSITNDGCRGRALTAGGFCRVEIALTTSGSTRARVNIPVGRTNVHIDLI